MRLIITFSLINISILLCQIGLAQEKCSEIKVAVNSDWTSYQIEKSEVYDFFQEQYGYELMMDSLPGFKDNQSEEEWKNSVHEFLFNFLQESNPTVHFISRGGDECDYSFTYNIGLIAIDNDYSRISDEGYIATGVLSTNNACGENRLIDVNYGRDIDLLQAIKNMVAQSGHLNIELYNYENDHLSPPRGPRILATTKERNFVSPLEDERKIEINLEVRNCKNAIVYEKSHGHEVGLQSRTNRSTLRNNIHQQAAFTIRDGNPLLIGLARPTTASVFYELKKGVNPDIEQIAIGTCGRDRMEIKTLNIIIDGLEILVRPKKPAIKPEESTSIDIYFNCVSPDGRKRPVAGKELILSVKGLVDGSVSPSGTITTDSNGKATLQYKSGKQDEKVTITASYQPVNYPDNVTGKGSVNVIPKYVWSGTINLEITERFNCNVEEQESELGIREVTAADEKMMVANISIGMDDFDLPTQSTNGGSALKYASGDYILKLSEDHLSTGRAMKTWCQSAPQHWESPGNWNTRHETMTGQAFRDIKLENLTMLIVKDIGFSKSSQNQMQNQAQEAAQMMELQRQMQEAGKNMDLEAIEALKEQMVKSVQWDKSSNTFPVIIRVQLVLDSKPDPLTTSYDYQNYNACLGTYADNESRSNTVDIPLVAPVSAEFKGTFTRGDNGQDNIKASVLLTETSQAGFYSDICPDKITTIKGEITLERQKE